MSPFPPQLGSPRLLAKPAKASRTEAGPPVAKSKLVEGRPDGPSPRLRLTNGQSTVSIQAGLTAVLVAAPADSFVTLGLRGPRRALRRFELVERTHLDGLRTATKDDDGLLPSFVSFATPEDREIEVMVMVDVTAPITLFRVVTPRAPHVPPAKDELLQARRRVHPLVGFPFPGDAAAGYVMQAPSRYLFIRADIAQAMHLALSQTRTRFRRNPIAIGDATQWDGKRPAVDLDKPRHISHGEGRDLDIGLPSRSIDASWLERRCQGVLVGKQELVCSPGTVKGLDALRLAYLLGLLIDGPTPNGRHVPDATRRKGPIAEVEAILTDQAYIDAIRQAIEVLKRRRWIHDEAYAALGEDGLLRPSPWHVDHVHVRFVGKPASVPAPLQFAAEPLHVEVAPVPSAK
ncbi:MAG: hypothetical protein VB934_06790 [Polyangiaceae bacterium]